MFFHRPLTILIGLISQSIIVNALTISDFTLLAKESYCASQDGPNDGGTFATISYRDRDDCFATSTCGKTDSDWESLLLGVATLFEPSTNKYHCFCFFDEVTLVKGSNIYELGVSGDGFFYPAFGNGSGELVATPAGPDHSCYKKGSLSGSDSLGTNADTKNETVTTQQGGANGDPIILGLQNQVFKFEGRDSAWYANLSSKNLQWNMQFKQFDSCPEDENMFITGMTLSTFDDDKGEFNSNILIVTTSEAISECDDDCLGEGTLHISFDGGKTFVSQPGDYHYSSRSRIVAHNTFAACSRKWYDYDVRRVEARRLRDGGRRATVQEKKPLQLLSDNASTMIDPFECGHWMHKRAINNDLFKQRGHWSTVYVETPHVSFHIEYRRSDSAHKCHYQSLDAWMTKVSDTFEETEWNGILGETKHKMYDLSTDKQVMSDRYQLLRGKDDADYEVDEPFGTKFAATEKGNSMSKIIS